MELQININLDNAAFQGDPAEEVARILESYCKDLKEQTFPAATKSLNLKFQGLNDKYSFMDYNGNQVGEAKVIEDLPVVTEIKEKPKAIIFIEGGLVQTVVADIDLSVALIDSDIQEEGNLLADMDGKPMNAQISEPYVVNNPKVVNYYFNQMDC